MKALLKNYILFYILSLKYKIHLQIKIQKKMHSPFFSCSSITGFFFFLQQYFLQQSRGSHLYPRGLRCAAVWIPDGTLSQFEPHKGFSLSVIQKGVDCQETLHLFYYASLSGHILSLEASPQEQQGQSQCSVNPQVCFTSSNELEGGRASLNPSVRLSPNNGPSGLLLT